MSAVMALQQGQYKEVGAKGQGVDRETVLPYVVGSLGEEEESEMNAFWMIVTLFFALGVSWAAGRCLAWMLAKHRVAKAHRTLRHYGMTVLPKAVNSCCPQYLVVIFTDGTYPDSLFCSHCAVQFAGEPCDHGLWEALDYERLRRHVPEEKDQVHTAVKQALHTLEDEREVWAPQPAHQPPPS